jgi:hypothetical protein
VRWISIIAVASTVPAAADPPRSEGPPERVPTHLAFEAGLAFFTPLVAKTPEVFRRQDGLQAHWTLSADQELCPRDWQLGGAITAWSYGDIDLAMRVSRRLDTRTLVRAGVGTFTCDHCRGLEDPRALVFAQIDHRRLTAFVQARITAFDLGRDARPLGTGVMVSVGAGTSDWRIAVVLTAIEMVAYVVTRPKPEGAN